MGSLGIIIVNYRTPTLVVECLSSLQYLKAKFDDLVVVVVDGFSNDGSCKLISAAVSRLSIDSWVRVIPLEVNGGFGFANNCAIAELTRFGCLPENIVLINPDARPVPGALEAMQALIESDNRIAAVGAQLIDEDGDLQSSAFRFPTLRSEICRGARTRLLERLLQVREIVIHPTEATEVPWVTGAAVMFRSSALAQVGAFDDGFFLYYEETELMYRLSQAGWTIWYEPTARVVHAGGAATQIREAKTGNPKTERLPQYWYESRLRYFSLTGGRYYAILAGFSLIAGHLIWELRRLLTITPANGTRSGIRDILRFGLWPRPKDLTSSAYDISQPFQEIPSWMLSNSSDIDY